MSYTSLYMRLYRQSVKASFRYACQSAVAGRYNEIKATVVLWRHSVRITIVSARRRCRLLAPKTGPPRAVLDDAFHHKQVISRHATLLSY